MRLFEHPEFKDAVLAAEAHFSGRGLRAAFIEKDYYVTEALRAIRRAAGDQVIFKGGTSLSKGWNLIERFSEDIDLFLDPETFAPPLGAKAIDRELKKLRDAVAAQTPLQFLANESQTIGGFGRADRFAYDTRLGGSAEVQPRILLEAGTASGREPTETVEISSYLAQFLVETHSAVEAKDIASFPFRLLHFRRTFVEKLFAIHAKVELLKRDGRKIGTYARHYYDLAQLAERAEVKEMLESEEYVAIRKDYDEISREHFNRDYTPPPELRFSSSEALFPPEPLARELQREYEVQCRLLCFGPYPSWGEVQARLGALRHLL